MISSKRHIKEDLPLLLKVALIFGLTGYSTSIIISYFINQTVNIYRFQYILYLVMLIKITFGLKKGYFTQALLIVFLSISYVFIITGPITIFFNSVYPLFNFFKDFYIPFLIFYYLLLCIKSSNQIEILLKWICYSGCFSVFLLFFEVLSIYFGKFSSFLQMKINYAETKGRSGLADILKATGIHFDELIRTQGLGTDYTSTAFLLATSFLILFIFKNRIIRNRYYFIIMFYLLYAGVYVTTSRTVFITLHIVMILLFGLTFVKMNHTIKYRLRINFILSCVFLCTTVSINILLGVLGIVDRMFASFGVSVFKFEGFLGTETLILYSDFISLISEAGNLLLENPFFFFFGFGAYTLKLPGLYLERAQVGEIHFYGDLFLTLGFIGFWIYLSIFFRSFYLFWKYNPINNINRLYGEEYYLLGFGLVILFILSALHYSPLDAGLSTPIIVALIPFLACYLKQSPA